jgi:hypothetical protein
MKHLFTFLFIFCIFRNAEAQSNAPAKPLGTNLSQVAIVTSSGGGPVAVQGNGFGGSTTVGLPFVGATQNGQYQSKLGLYVDLNKHSGTKSVPLSKTERSTANIYPNPTKGDVAINLPADFGAPSRVTLFDEHGGELGNLKYSFVGEKLLMQIPNRAAGIYFIRVEGKNVVEAYKFTIVK